MTTPHKPNCAALKEGSCHCGARARDFRLDINKKRGIGDANGETPYLRFLEKLRQESEAERAQRYKGAPTLTDLLPDLIPRGRKKK